MTRTHERAVAAMGAIGNSVTGAPPLRLPPNPAPSRSPRSSRSAWSPRAARSAARAWRLWLVPAGAALAVVAIAVSLVLVRSAPRDSAIAPSTAVPGSSGAVGPDGVPQYYVAFSPTAFGWYAYVPATPKPKPTPPANSGGLIIGSTATGKRLATVAPLAHLTFNVVTAAADDQTFVVGAASPTPPTSIHWQKTNSGSAAETWSETWYLLRISPGSAHVAQLTKLPVPPTSGLSGVALSPDGTELAVAYQLPLGGSAGGSPGLTLWSTATGKVLRHWATDKGQITAATPSSSGYQADAQPSAALSTALRWTPDGRDLAFAWNGSEIRLLNLASPTSQDSDLGQASTLRAAIGPSYTGAGAIFTCDAADGWALSAGATTFTCAGSFTPADLRTAPAPGQTPPARPGDCPKATPAHLAFIQQIVQTGDTELRVLGESSTCTSVNSRGSEATLGWASADGSKIIGELQIEFDYGTQYGIFSEKHFAQLPALPANAGVTTVAW